MIPAKADPDKQGAYLAQEIEPRLAEAQAGKRAVSYLKERGIDDETISRAKLGFAPEDWSGLINFAEVILLNEDFPGFAAIGRPDDAVAFHHIDEARCAAISQAQPPLQGYDSTTAAPSAGFAFARYAS